MSDDQQTPESDEALLRRIRNGDATATDALTKRYWEAIFRYCRSYLHEPARAEDVAQETFAKLGHEESLPDGAVKPWLYRVARNRCLDILRRFKRSPTHHNRVQTGFDAARGGAGPQTHAVRRERREIIRSIIDEMPEDFRGVLILKFYENLSRAEMAAALDVSEAVVKGRLVRASQYLEDELRRITGSWT
jgi:RNA polymerase sigma-70 factor (ECF subfamily)